MVLSSTLNDVFCYRAIHGPDLDAVMLKLSSTKEWKKQNATYSAIDVQAQKDCVELMLVVGVDLLLSHQTMVLL